MEGFQYRFIGLADGALYDTLQPGLFLDNPVQVNVSELGSGKPLADAASKYASFADVKTDKTAKAVGLFALSVHLDELASKGWQVIHAADDSLLLRRPVIYGGEA